jgi:hypothetical protein
VNFKQRLLYTSKSSSPRTSCNVHISCNNSQQLQAEFTTHDPLSDFRLRDSRPVGSGSVLTLLYAIQEPILTSLCAVCTDCCVVLWLECSHGPLRTLPDCFNCPRHASYNTSFNFTNNSTTFNIHIITAPTYFNTLASSSAVCCSQL